MPSPVICPQCGTVSDRQSANCPVCLLRLAVSPDWQSDSLSGLDGKNSPAEGPRIFGDYELVSEVARGGMGVVYKARQISLNRVVAVKMLLWGRFASDEFVRRFKREAAAIAGLQHPSIVAIHEFGECEGIAYFSMDYIEGQDMSALVRTQPLSVRTAARQIQLLAEAMQYAHDRGVVHRDLKPSNIMIDATGAPRITDFGLAKQLDADLERTQTEGVFGSPGYMAPEQAFPREQKSSGKSADIYSLGAILYFLLTGRPPFLATTLEDTLLDLQKGDVVRPRSLNRSVPADLEVICLKCLEKNPASRYGSAGELGLELTRFLAGDPIHARPPGVARRAWRWSRRRPALAVTALLLFAITAGSIVVAAHMQQMRERMRQSLYAADMNVAARNLEENNFAQASALLERYRPRPGAKDLRGFEWRYLWSQCHSKSAVALPMHRQVAGMLSFTLDGRNLAAFYWDGSAEVWNVDARQRGHGPTNISPAGGFTADGDLCVSDAAGILYVKEADTGKTLRSWPHAGELLGIGRSGGVTLLLTSSNRLELRDLADGRIKFSTPLPGSLQADYGLRPPVAINADGSKVAIALPLGSVKGARQISVWNTEGGKLTEKFVEQKTVRCLEFDPVSGFLAGGLSNGEISLWNLDTKERLVISAHQGPVLSLAFATNQLLASGSSDQSIRIWDMRGGVPREPAHVFNHRGEVWSLAFSSDGRRLASGGRDNPLRIWDPLEAEKNSQVISGLLTEEFSNFVFSPDSLWMAAGCKDHSIKVWEVATLRIQAVLSGMSYVVCFSPDSKSILASTHEGAACWWDIATKTKRSVPSYNGNLNDVKSVDFSPDGQMAALGSVTGDIYLLEIDTGRVVKTLSGHTNSVLSLKFSSSGGRLFSGSRDRFLRSWDVATGLAVDGCQDHKGSIFAVAISPNGKMVASGCGADTIKFWHPDHLKQRAFTSFSYHRSTVKSLAFSPDNKTLASGSEDKTVKLWSLPFGTEVTSFRFKQSVQLVAFSADGRNLAAITDGGELTLFRTPTFSEISQIESQEKEFR